MNSSVNKKEETCIEFFRHTPHALSICILAKSSLFPSPVAAVSVLSSLLLAFGLETQSEMLLAEALVIGRVLFRLLRLVSLAKSFRQQHVHHRRLEASRAPPFFSSPS